MDLVLLSASELRRLIDAGRVSAKEVAGACIARIKAVDPLVQSFVTLVDEERVMAAADEAQKRIKQSAGSPLAGIPYALKDLTETIGLRTTFGSRLREKYVPSEDAAVARRQSNDIRRCVGRHALSQAAPYRARARHSANAIERLCL